MVFANIFKVNKAEIVYTLVQKLFESLHKNRVCHG